jgi:hypothetical protein
VPPKVAVAAIPHPTSISSGSISLDHVVELLFGSSATMMYESSGSWEKLNGVSAFPSEDAANVRVAWDDDWDKVVTNSNGDCAPSKVMNDWEQEYELLLWTTLPEQPNKVVCVPFHNSYSWANDHPPE